MSLEMHVFLKKSSLPGRESWQDAVAFLKLPVVLDPELDLLKDSRFSPAKLGDMDSGFEIYSGPAQDVLQNYPDLTRTITDQDWCVTFRWGSDVNECACVLAASAGLVKLCNAVAFYPDDEMFYDLDRLLDEANSIVSDGHE